jgi:thioredoxin 1
MDKKVIRFTAVWCQPCRAYAPVWDKVKESTEGWEWEVYDVDKDPSESSKYSITSIPTTIFEIDGEVVDRYTGLLNAPELKKRLEKATK